MSFAREKLCPLFEAMHFAIAVDPKSLHAILGAKLPPCVPVADETKTAVTLIAAVRRQCRPPSGGLRRSFLHFFHRLIAKGL
jgi:hypothetical protein